ncbi:DUF4173 domain-containing protein [Paenibacillus sp. HB172176]|uniref:DUF4173 domain-containing protein n=1 Tax=Paenibacillus sp. HB172176 TaxID=2493690 RepID=UPI001439A51F|nr:DUF4173 domain-containing protein [Paenibacillus sp. HB172176]
MKENNIVLEKLNSPHELERWFRAEPDAFRDSFAAAWERKPDSPVLAVWNERLHYKEPVEPTKGPLLHNNFYVMGILALLAGICARLILHFVEREAISPVNFAFAVFPVMALYFLVQHRPRRTNIYILAASFLVSGIYLNLLPLEQTDSVLLAYIHLPILLWMLVGIAYAGDDYRLGSSRLAFLKFNGEFAILYACMAICGMLLTGLTVQLFRVAGMDISQLYFENVVCFGAAALAIVAAHLISGNLKLAKDIAPHIARIFSPLVLATLTIYLITVTVAGENPFMDRDFLIVFNGILLLVLAVTIFSITERGANEKRSLPDGINFALIALALVIDSVALAAMAFRLSSYGITPNRIAVLGANILIWANLIWILLAYIRFLKKETGPSVIQNAVTKYLPIYGLWAAVVAFSFPLLFD